MAVLLGAEVERGREKQPPCRRDMKATGCDRKSRQTAGRSSKNLPLSHTRKHSDADKYTDHTDQMSGTVTQGLYSKRIASLMVNRSGIIARLGKLYYAHKQTAKTKLKIQFLSF